MTTECPFDHHSREHAADPVGTYRAVREGPGFVRTPAHGGYTLFARYDDIAEVTQSPERFSSALALPGDDGIGGGVTLPRNPAASRMSLAEMDPPEWRHVRRLLNPLFRPDAVARFAPRIREVTDECIDRFIGSGSCDLVLDLCSPVPAIVTLEYLGIDTSEWERYAVPIHSSTFTPRDPQTPAFQALGANFQWIFQQIREEIARRRESPRKDDLLAAMMEAEDSEGPLDDDLVFETAYTVLAAGVDTTTSLLSAALQHLDLHPGDRRRLIDDPSLLEVACEEFLRYYSPAQAAARTTVGEARIGETALERGDRVLLAWASANRDEARFEQPDDFVVDRRPNRHMAFGHGIHRCIGAGLARQEFIVAIGQVLRRMPDYRIDRSRTETYPDVGLMFGYKEMPATFTPGGPLRPA